MCVGGLLRLRIAFFGMWGGRAVADAPALSAGHRGSAAARVFKVFQTEHGEHFNVSSSSEWVQGEESATTRETRTVGEKGRTFCLCKTRIFLWRQ